MRTNSIVNTSKACEMQKREIWKRNCNQNHSITITLWIAVCYIFVSPSVWSSKVGVVSYDNWKCQQEQEECVCLQVDLWDCDAGGQQYRVTIFTVCGTILSLNDFFSVNS